MILIKTLQHNDYDNKLSLKRNTLFINVKLDVNYDFYIQILSKIIIIYIALSNNCTLHFWCFFM